MERPVEIEQVKDFWENSPLFSDESKYEPGSFEFFEEHKKVYYQDVFEGKVDSYFDKFIPHIPLNGQVLDLGCGVGFWSIEISKRFKVNLVAADLTENAINITKKRMGYYNISGLLEVQNAENLTFKSDLFDHVNCQGVIHHTPNTEQCVKEIARVLVSGGTASISVYYKNFFLRNWKLFNFFGKLLKKFGAGMKGRGRENIYEVKEVNDIVRLYDGNENPLGKAYSKKEFHQMCEPYFEVKSTDLFFFPARSFPVRIPSAIHHFLAKNFGFMIHLSLIKK